MCHKQPHTHSSGFLDVPKAFNVQVSGGAGLHLELFLGALSYVNLFISVQNERNQT